MNYIQTSKLKENPDNPRSISDEKFAKLVQSIKAFPEMLELRPIVVDSEMVVLGGNMRLKALKEIGVKEVPVLKAGDLTEEQKRQFIIKDNVGFGEWDWDILANEWDSQELNDWGLDVWQPEEELEAEEDDYQEPEEMKVDVVLGDLIEIGEHRLLCGDSTDSDQVAKLMNGEKADMVFTDPPYNLDYGANANHPSHKIRKIENDKMSDEDWNQFVIGYMNSIFQMTDYNIYISMSEKELGHMQQTFRDCGGKWASFIIWVKDSLVLSAKDYHSRHETIMYGWKDGAKERLRVEDRKQDDVWEISRPKKSDEHPTMKPIELMERAINNSSRIGMLIGDIFLGSGSTMVAAHQLKRKCYGMELDPKYCQVIIDRMKKLDSDLVVKINGKEYGI